MRNADSSKGETLLLGSAISAMRSSIQIGALIISGGGVSGNQITLANKTAPPSVGGEAIMPPNASSSIIHTANDTSITLPGVQA
jgi:hypothetical protein